jgi:hypothetical protein
VGPRASVDAVAKRKISLPLLVIEPNFRKRGNNVLEDLYIHFYLISFVSYRFVFCCAIQTLARAMIAQSV